MPVRGGSSRGLSAADCDKTPTTPADWAGTRADYIQDYKQDNPMGGLLSGLFGGGGGERRRDQRCPGIGPLRTAGSLTVAKGRSPDISPYPAGDGLQFRQDLDGRVVGMDAPCAKDVSFGPEDFRSGRELNPRYDWH